MSVLRRLGWSSSHVSMSSTCVAVGFVARLYACEASDSAICVSGSLLAVAEGRGG
jgi:hypothetical protein